VLVCRIWNDENGLLVIFQKVGCLRQVFFFSSWYPENQGKLEAVLRLHSNHLETDIGLLLEISSACGDSGVTLANIRAI